MTKCAFCRLPGHRVNQCGHPSANHVKMSIRRGLHSIMDKYSFNRYSILANPPRTTEEEISSYYNAIKEMYYYLTGSKMVYYISHEIVFMEKVTFPALKLYACSIGTACGSSSFSDLAERITKIYIRHIYTNPYNPNTRDYIIEPLAKYIDKCLDIAQNVFENRIQPRRPYVMNIQAFFIETKPTLILDNIPYECGICYENYPNNSNKSVLNPCNHEFCTLCIITHASMNNRNCPFCRVPFSKLHTTRV